MAQLGEVTVLMLTHVLHNLPTARHNAWLCSSGSKGYCAVKEMLQNGIPGHTILIESGDLREVDASCDVAGCCLLTYCLDVDGDEEDSDYDDGDEEDSDYDNIYREDYFDDDDDEEQGIRNPIPCTDKHVVVYSNSTKNPIPSHLLKGCSGLDLSPLSHVTQVQVGFLARCTELKTLDLSPLSQVRKVPAGFLWECFDLAVLDLSPLSQVTEVQAGFLARCCSLTALDLSPLSRVRKVQNGFLFGCSGLLSKPPEGWSMAANQWVQKFPVRRKLG